MIQNRIGKGHQTVMAAALGLFAIATPAAAQESARIGDLAALIAPLPQNPTLHIDVSALTLHSDFTVFMERGCPEELRLSALRRLWTLLPAADVVENSAI